MCGQKNSDVIIFYHSWSCAIESYTSRSFTQLCCIRTSHSDKVENISPKTWPPRGDDGIPITFLDGAFLHDPQMADRFTERTMGFSDFLNVPPPQSNQFRQDPKNIVSCRFAFFEWSPPTDILSDTYSGIIPGILLTYILAICLAFYLTYIPAFYLVFFLKHIYIYIFILLYNIHIYIYVA